MKARTIAGALAAATLWSGTALAGDDPNCPPRSSELSQQESSTAVGGSGWSQQQSAQPTPEQQPAYVAPVVVAEEDEVRLEDERKKNDNKGLTVLLGGGVEGYTGDLAPEIRPGASYGVTAAIKPTSVLGIELGYSGGVNNLRDDAGNGADVVRNGGQAAITLALTPTAVQPYVLGGVGFNRYNLRGDSEGFRDDTSGYIPLGVGLRTHIGDFTADARGTWSALFNEDFSDTATTDILGVDVAQAGRFGGLIQLGTTF